MWCARRFELDTHTSFPDRYRRILWHIFCLCWTFYDLSWVSLHVSLALRDERKCLVDNEKLSLDFRRHEQIQVLLRLRYFVYIFDGVSCTKNFPTCWLWTCCNCDFNFFFPHNLHSWGRVSFYIFCYYASNWENYKWLRNRSIQGIYRQVWILGNKIHCKLSLIFLDRFWNCAAVFGIVLVNAIIECYSWSTVTSEDSVIVINFVKCFSAALIFAVFGQYKKNTTMTRCRMQTLLKVWRTKLLSTTIISE